MLGDQCVIPAGHDPNMQRAKQNTAPQSPIYTPPAISCHPVFLPIQRTGIALIIISPRLHQLHTHSIMSPLPEVLYDVARNPYLAGTPISRLLPRSPRRSLYLCVGAGPAGGRVPLRIRDSWGEWKHRGTAARKGKRGRKSRC